MYSYIFEKIYICNDSDKNQWTYFWSQRKVYCFKFFYIVSISIYINNTYTYMYPKADTRNKGGEGS